MKRDIGLIIAILVLVLIVVVMLTQHKEIEKVVTFELVGPTSVRVGEDVRIDIVVENVDRAQGVQADITFTPDILQYQRVEEGDFLNRGGTEATAFMDEINTEVPGEITGLEIIKAGTGVSGNGTIASMYFKAIGQGNAELGIPRATVGRIANGEAVQSEVRTKTLTFRVS